MNPPPTRPILPFLLALLTVGCAEYGMSKNDLDSGAQAPREDTVVNDYLRVDLYPSDQTPDLLPETHILDEEWEGLTLPMSSPVTVSGEVWGYDATPYFDISVPGSSTPIEARISVYQPGTIMSAGASTRADEDGAFQLRLPRASDYTFSVVPVEPTQLPFLVEQGLSFDHDQLDQLIELDYGAPIYGYVRNSSGLPLSTLEVELWVRDPATGTVGPSTTPDEDGFYQLRALPGASYQVVMAGAAGELVPTTSQDVLVESEVGAELDFDIGVIQAVGVNGQVLSTGSAEVESAIVRFTSLELTDFPGGELSLDDITNSRGEYRVQLLPGRYMAEFIAPASIGLSPAQATLVVDGQGDGDDYDVYLEELGVVESQVLGPDGEPLAGVTVVATERGFDGYTYAATSDDSGRFQLMVPAVKLQFVLTPPEGEASVTYIEVPVEEFPAIIMLDEGQAISGAVVHDDEPVPFALVEVRDSEDQLYATTLTDELGEFQVRVRWEGSPDDTGD
jgi:hypothetical protein